MRQDSLEVFNASDLDLQTRRSKIDGLNVVSAALNVSEVQRGQRQTVRPYGDGKWVLDRVAALKLRLKLQQVVMKEDTSINSKCDTSWSSALDPLRR